MDSLSYFYQMIESMAEIDKDLLNRYPKKRPELPQAYQEIYSLHYTRNRQGATKATSLSSKLEQWLHRAVCADLKTMDDPETLEIGAGTLNHLAYEPEIHRYDIIEPFDALLSVAENKDRVRNFYRDIREVPKEQSYDRIISIATFEHIEDLPYVVASSALHLKPEGSMRISIPNEGRPLWNMGTQITGAEFKRMYGLDYRVLMKHEHINSAAEIEDVLRVFFRKIRSKHFGISKFWSFYLFFECTQPDIEMARAYIESYERA